MSIDIRKNTKEVEFWILIPVYNVEEYIDDCISSVLNQSYDKFKIVLLDDGSKDKSGDICDEYAKNDNRIKVIHQENQGLISARQNSIKYMKNILGETEKNVFVIFLDSDDSLKENALERIKTINVDMDYDLIIYGYDRVMDGKIIYPYDNTNSYQGEITDKRELYAKVFEDAGYNSVCRKAISYNLIKSINADYTDFYYIKHAEDLLQSIEYYKNCRKVYFLNESLYNYAINLNSITHSVNANNLVIDFTVREKVIDFLINEDVFEEDDWKKYRTYCIKILCSLIEDICLLDTSKTRKINFWNQIRESVYFNKYINDLEYDKSSLGKTNKIYEAFLKEKYGLLYFAGWGYLKLIKLKKRLCRLGKKC